MASRKALLLAAAAMTVVMGALLPATAWPENHIVGEFQGWQLGVDYTNWASVNDGIPVGDTLNFIYRRGVHNVIQVDENTYNTCVLPGIVTVWDTGNDKLQLVAAGKYFFICGIADHCSRGMKLAITAI